ncbi:uncharacterized protein A4U43_C04F13400 [Asparagus officinalis]|uniref:Uncharacterized protein n=1 Tax=Asparagus officinalis TaxID=4686 RepID=A0A5P1F3A4_ASPOF|nr:uncharacterized protein A4U43_C04F13400 [Asparagus officinalis]
MKSCSPQRSLDADEASVVENGEGVALVSIVHLFFTTLLPSSLDYFEVGRAQSSCSPVNSSAGLKSEHLDGNSELGIDFDKQFPVDSHGAVTYHGAPWKAEIGKWFSGCGDVLNVVDVVELIYGAKGARMTVAAKEYAIGNWGNACVFMGFLVIMDEVVVAVESVRKE